MYIIRADGNTVIGMGHVMRCLSVADALRERGIMPIFLLADNACQDMIQERGHQVHVLGTDYRNMESELPLIRTFLEAAPKKQQRHVILVDSYQVTQTYYKELGKLAGVACLEDMGEAYPVDLLINYNIYAPSLHYNDKITHATLLGTRYQPLREEFQQNIVYSVRDKITDVMITTGGGDALFATKAFMECFLKCEELKDLRYHIVSGPFNTHAQELHWLYDARENVEVHEHVSCMKELMRQCDVILSATGSTIYEVSALGVPLIAFYFAANQQQGAERLSEITSVINCGNFAEKPQETVEMAKKTLLRCLKDRSYREALYREERQLVDGRGAARIAAALEELA